jgi:hypothetical protein
MIPIGVGRKKDHRSVKWVWVLLFIVLGNAAHSVSHYYCISPAPEQSNVLGVSKTGADEQAQFGFSTYHNCLACESFQHAPSQTRCFLIAPLPPTVEHDALPAFWPVAATIKQSSSERGPPLI